jgi:hypothetical protein
MWVHSIRVDEILPSKGSSRGIKVVADFEIASLILQTEGAVKEFPELDILKSPSSVKFWVSLEAVSGLI